MRKNIIRVYADIFIIFANSIVFREFLETNKHKYDSYLKKNINVEMLSGKMLKNFIFVRLLRCEV